MARTTPRAPKCKPIRACTHCYFRKRMFSAKAQGSLKLKPTPRARIYSLPQRGRSLDNRCQLANFKSYVCGNMSTTFFALSGYKGIYHRFLRSREYIQRIYYYGICHSTLYYLEFNHSITGLSFSSLTPSKPFSMVSIASINFSSLSLRFFSVLTNMDIIIRSIPLRSLRGKQPPRR